LIGVYIHIGLLAVAAMFAVSAVIVSCGSGEPKEIDDNFNIDGIGSGAEVFLKNCYGLGDRNGNPGTPANESDPDCDEFYLTANPPDEPVPPPPPPGESSSSGGDYPPPPPVGGSSSSDGGSEPEPPPPPPGVPGCQNVNRSVPAGTAITKPNVYCGENTVVGSNWTTSPPIDWDNPVAGSYTSVSVEVPCDNANPRVTCSGTITVTALSSSSRPASSSSVAPSSSSRPSSSSVTPSSSSVPRSSSSVTPSSSSVPRSSSSVQSSSSVTPPSGCTDLSLDQTSSNWTEVTGCKKIKCSQGNWGQTSSVVCRVSSPNVACTLADYAVTIDLNGSAVEVGLTDCWNPKKVGINLTCNGSAESTVSVPTGKTISCKGNETPQ
jgi:hypothetical protein